MRVGRGVAFVTGASSGLGRGVARRLAREGWSVGLSARRASKLHELAEQIEHEGGTVGVFPCDVSEQSRVMAAVEACREELGPVELLVANAGVSEMTLVDDFSAADVERLLRINFLGAVYPVEAVLPGMLERGRGHLVGIGSLAGFRGLPKTAAYSASKGALHNFFESLRIDLRATGVDVTLVTPGYVDTPMTRQNDHAMPFLVELEDAVDRIVAAVHRKRRFLSFPAPLATVVWLARLLPAGLYDALAARQPRDKKERP